MRLLREGIRSPLFLLGLSLRLILIFLIVPAPITDWYAPFLEESVRNFSLDPWASWLSSGGSPVAFPYGYTMWLSFLSSSVLFSLLKIPMAFAISATLLTADLILLALLLQLLPSRARLIYCAYWLSPIVIVATYVLGFNDLIPVTILVASVLLLRRSSHFACGLVLGAAISAKLSMVLAIPFFAIYYRNNRSLTGKSFSFYSGFSIAALAFGLPFLVSSDGLQMLVSNPEMAKVFEMALEVGRRIEIYIVPLVYMGIVYATWRVRRLNFDLFQVTTGLALLTIVLLTPASPGWFIWALPFLVLSQAGRDFTSMFLLLSFSWVYGVSTLLISTIMLRDGYAIHLEEALGLTGRSGSLIYTLMCGLGLIFSVRCWREAVQRNDFFRFSQKPFLIGIAGDSGVGKDTLADGLTGLFGAHSTVRLSGDDYHLWDRQQPMWHIMTHLNPMANNLEKFASDLLALADRRPIVGRHYDHSTGKMSLPQVIQSKDIVIGTGLHALYLPMIRDCYDLKIFLELDETLRIYFKMRRDVDQRGHNREKVLASISKRKPDGERFISPQADSADLIFKVSPANVSSLDEHNRIRPLRLKLSVQSAQLSNELSLHRVLVGLLGLHVETFRNETTSRQEMTIEGDVSSADIAVAAGIVCPRILDFLASEPEWLDDIGGLMQLICLSQINQSLSRRVL